MFYSFLLNYVTFPLNHYVKMTLIIAYYLIVIIVIIITNIIAIFY